MALPAVLGFLARPDRGASPALAEPGFERQRSGLSGTLPVRFRKKGLILLWLTVLEAVSPTTPDRLYEALQDITALVDASAC